jgi:DNA-binding transcriptional LysR family regulator
VRQRRAAAAREHAETDQMRVDGMVDVGDQPPHLDIAEAGRDIGAGGIEREPADQPSVTAVHPPGAEGEVAHADRVRPSPGRQISAERAGEAVGVGMPLDHPLAGRTSVSVDELADQPFITAREGHWIRRLLDRLFAARDLTPKIVCESDEPSAIADLIGAGLGIGLVPAFARRSATRASGVWIAVDNPDCRRAVTLYWGAGNHLSPAARLMRTTITGWDWITGEPQEKNADDR